jgi:hypothetical protein
MSSNGGFPPLKIIKNNNNKKERHFKPHKQTEGNNINLSIKNILLPSVVKPMIDLNKQSVEKVIDNL